MQQTCPFSSTGLRSLRGRAVLPETILTSMLARLESDLWDGSGASGSEFRPVWESAREVCRPAQETPKAQTSLMTRWTEGESSPASHRKLNGSAAHTLPTFPNKSV